jgi:hypothetical protein
MKLHYLILTFLLAALCVVSVAGQKTSVNKADSRELSKEERDGLLKFREQAWRDFFAGNKAGLEKALPTNFIGIGWGHEEDRFSDRKDAVVNAESFAKSGGKLTRLEFPETKIQAWGDVVIFYTTFDLDLEGGDGKKTTIKGHGTEIFVKEDGKWIHPGWHLDNY